LRDAAAAMIIATSQPMIYQDALRAPPESG
jgi:hypothetical protein